MDGEWEGLGVGLGRDHTQAVGTATPLQSSSIGLWVLAPHIGVQIHSLTSLCTISSSDDHKPIWMHAEEREEMNRVRGSTLA